MLVYTRTRALPDGYVLYVLLTAPGRAYPEAEAAFQRMLRSLPVNDAAAHRATSNSLRYLP